MPNPFLTELAKALSTTGDGAALVPYDLDTMLHEELLTLQPLTQLMEVEQANGKTHEFNVRSSHPQAWFEGESTSGTAVNSVYARKSVQLKIQRIWGEVTGFAQTVDEAFIDALAEEIMGSIEGMADLFEYGMLFGTASDLGFTGDAYQYSGVLPNVYANAATNVIDAGGNKVTLDDLDAAYAKAAGFRQVRNDPKLWLMSMRMKQVVDGLQTKVQLPLQEVTLADGKLVMAGYSETPIFESDFVAAGQGTSPAVTAAKAAGGDLADETYTYRISSVTLYGEQVGGTASSGVTTETTNNSVDLTWTADDYAKLYMIWRKIGSGSYELLDIIPANTYDSSGAVNGQVESYTDDGSRTAIAIKPLESGEQLIALVNRNPRRGAAFIGKIDERGRQIDRLVSFVELAQTKDAYPYFLKSYLAVKNVHPNVHAVIRHVKLA